jgi:hypothetical protein
MPNGVWGCGHAMPCHAMPCLRQAGLRQAGLRQLKLRIVGHCSDEGDNAADGKVSSIAVSRLAEAGRPTT